MKRTAVGCQTIRDEEVRAGTGKGWNEWCDLIQAARVKNNMASIVQYLYASHRLDHLWARIIAVYYKWHV